MQIHWTFDGCSEHEMAQVAAYWDRVQNELEAKIAGLSDAPSELRIAVDRSESEPTWQIQAALHVPGNAVVADGEGRTPEKALDHVLRGLATGIDQLEEVAPAFTFRRDGLGDVISLLESYRTRKDRSEAFLSFLAPVVAGLGPYVQHELAIRDSEGSIVGEQVSPADILDQVLIDAWEMFPQRNRDLPLDLWLVQLADQAMDRASSPSDQQSIDDETESIPEMDGSNWEEWAELATFPDAIELRELLPGGPEIGAWDEFDFDTKQAHLSQMLARLTREQRQAFVLNAVHGFNATEIADFQNRSVALVESDIAAASSAVHKYFLDEQTTDLEERFVRRELREFRRRRG